MGTPVDFWSLEDCVKALSDLSENRAANTGVSVASPPVQEVEEEARTTKWKSGALFHRTAGDSGRMSGYSNSEDAVRQLLAEKERDLELAAQIGSRLLEQNKELEFRLENLDTQLQSANDRAQQLKHELTQKEQLVQVYSRICEEAQGDDVWSSQTSTQPSPQHMQPQQPSPTGSTTDIFSPRTSRRGTLSTGLDQLQTQISQLEEENNRLRLEHSHLLTQRSTKQEKIVAEDCLKQLSEANSYIRNLSEDLSKKTDKFMERQSEVTNLFSRATDMEKRVKSLATDNLTLNNRLVDAQTSQDALTSQLTDLRDKYDQCLSMLSAAHDEIRRVQWHQTAQPPAAPPSASPAGGLTLAAELEASLLAEVEEDDEGSLLLSDAPSTRSERPARPSMPLTALPADLGAPRRASCPWVRRTDDGGGRRAARDDSEPSSTDSGASVTSESDEDTVWHRRRPLPPSGGRRKAARRQRRTCKRLQHHRDPPAYQQQQAAAAGQQQQGGTESPRWSPSIRLPSGQPLQDKVQMVKSMEGSTTLRQWQRLARPSMSGALFERRPGVRVRGCSGSRNSAGLGLGGLGGLGDSDDQEGSDSGSEREQAPPGPAVALPPGPEAEAEAEVAAITFRMRSAPPDPSRTLEALGQRRSRPDNKRSPLAPPDDTAEAEAVPSATANTAAAVAASGNVALSGADSSTGTRAFSELRATDSTRPTALSSTNLAAILSEKGIHSKTYAELVGEGFPVLPGPAPPPQPPPPPAFPATPRNSPTLELEEGHLKEASPGPGPVNPTLVFAGLLESLSELFRPAGSSTPRQAESGHRGSMGRRHWASESRLDTGLNAVAKAPVSGVAAVLHRTDSSSGSPRKK